MKIFKHLLLLLSILCSPLLFTNCGQDKDDAITSKPILTITIFPSSGGSVSPQGGAYDAGTTVELTATANVDYTFTGWTGDFTGSSNPVTLTMLTNQTVIANFEIQDADGDGVGDSVDNCAETAIDAMVDENGCSDSYEIYLDENGVTIKASENAVIGERYVLDGVSYLIVDSIMLYQMINDSLDVTKIITSFITDMSYMFPSSNFNQDISHWDISNVKNMRVMFYYNSFFNQDISHWDVSEVTDMGDMLASASSFNQDLSAWDVDKVTFCNDFSANSTAWTKPKPNFTNCTE